MFNLFAHTDEADEVPVEAAEAVSSGLFDSIAHQPAWAAFLISAFVLVAVFSIFRLFKVKPINALFALLPVIIGLSILFMGHNPAIATILMSGGFIMAFILAFTLLQTNQK